VRKFNLLKAKLVQIKFFVKKHPILFKLAKFLLKFFPKKMAEKIRKINIPDQKGQNNISANCIICGSERLLASTRTQEYRGVVYTIAHCQNCGVSFTLPLPTDELLNLVYTEDFNYQWYKDYTEFKLIDAGERVEELKEFLASPILDYGGGIGYFAEKCRASGYRADLYDPYTLNKPLCGKYSTICSFHALEHSNNPAGFLRELKSFLEENGRLIIAVPNAAGIGYRRDFYSWVWSQPPITHILHFTKKSLSILLIDLGFEVEKVIFNDRWDANYAADVLMKEQTTYFGSQWSVHIGDELLRGESVKIDGEYRNLCNKISSLISLDDEDRAELMIVARLKGT
jgi:SAM-dependent methyltransferase